MKSVKELIKDRKEKKGIYTIPKELHDKRIAKQYEGIMTNREKLESLKDVLIRGLEGSSDFIILKRRLELILLIEQIKSITK